MERPEAEAFPLAADRMKADEALRASEHLYRQTLQALPAHIAVIDRQGRIIAVNEAWTHFAARNEASDLARVAVGANYLEVCRRASAENVADADMALAGIEAVLRGAAKPFTMEYPCHSPRKERWFLMTAVSLGGGGEGGAVITHLNITDRKRAEQEVQRLLATVREEKEKLSCLLNSITDEVWFADTHKNFTLANASAVRAFGLEVPTGIDVEGLAASLEVRRGDGTLRPVSEAPALRALDGETIRDEEEMIRIPGKGELRFRQISSAPVRDVAGVIIGSVSVVHDITARKQAEEAARRSSEELARSNRELEQFAHVASHDLKEPLRMVTGFTTLLRERYEDQLDARAREYIGFASGAATHMQELIDGLLTYARVGRDPAHFAVNAGDMARRALENLSVSVQEAGARITIDPLPTVKANELMLTQLFQNLIGNSIKFRDPRRPVEIQVSARRLEEGPVAGRSVQAPCYLFTIRDNGIGLDLQYKERIFEIFQRLHTKDEYAGAGVGLAICKKIVEQLGGGIGVESKSGEGSTFFFTIPLAY